MKSFTVNAFVSEVCVTDKGEVVVLGVVPKSDDELAHNCDAMGCGQSHVLWRSWGSALLGPSSAVGGERK